jgi:hypothetical protein
MRAAEEIRKLDELKANGSIVDAVARSGFAIFNARGGV